ncbi:YiiQ family protein [Pectobacterium cacticida]|uniref:YiiQ family protein n=1 Tax=Pectobacterium cacticida TaxID=69221 RepID=A0ABZ2GAQ2_9GAMM|nr:YiiQ family protein [Pectobacterium cacticida]UYX06704.1 YiiQ family protein [Pectobacterium cacticida]
MTRKCIALLFLSSLALYQASAGADPTFPPDTSANAPYLLAGAPTFDQTISQFRSRYNLSNPTLPIGEFRIVDSGNIADALTRAASRINDSLYASTALEKGTGKIKTLQITWLPQSQNEQETAASRQQAVNYMAALARAFAPSLTEAQSVKKVAELLEKGKGQRFYQQSEGALRFVVADNGEKGLTFAVEPIKLTLSEP